LEGEPFAFDGEALGVKVAAPQPGDVSAKFVESGTFCFRVLFGGDGMGSGGEVESRPTGELCRERISKCFLPVGLFVFEAADDFQRLLTGLPVAVAALLPGGEIDCVDGATVELGFEDCLDFRQGVKPREDGFCFLAVREALVGLFADDMGVSGRFFRWRS